MFVFPPEIDTTSGVPDPKPEAQPSEIFDALLLANEETSLRGRDHAQEEAVDRRNDAIFRATGERLENPMRVYQPYTPEGVTETPRDPFAVDAWHAKLQELSERYPQYRDVIRPDVTLQQAGIEEAQRAVGVAADVWDRAPNSIGTYAAAIGATVTSMVKDKTLWVTGPLFPAGRAAGGAAGVAWQAIKIGAANAALTAAEQPFIQAWRKEAGLDYGVVSALEETAASFLAGAVLEGGIRGGWRGFRQLQGKTQVLNDAGEVIGYQSRRRDNPLQALDDAASAAPEGSLIRKAQAGDREALATLAEKTGLHETPEVRAALDVLGREEAERVPPAGVVIEDHVQRFNDAMRGAQDPRALPPGDALVHASEVTAAPERIAEVMQQDPLELAAQIRETPEMLQEGLPWQDPQLRAAAHLSRLDDGAFNMVAGGEAHPMLGAIVAEHVADADRHAGILRQLAEADPKTPGEARAKLSDLLAGPKDDATHARVAGIGDDPRFTRDGSLVDRPVTLVDDPYGRDASIQLEQLRKEHAAEIEAAGGAVAKAVEDGKAETGQALARLEKKVDAEISAHTKLAAALDKALGRLPDGVEVKSFADIADLPKDLQRGVLAARSAGGRVEALTESQTGNIWIAVDALDVDGTLSHETIHALRQVGLLMDHELQMLADAAAKVPDIFDRALYEQAYAHFDPDLFKEVMLQEAAAHLYEARANGANFGKDANAILRKIKQFLERARNALKGLGWQSADDIMKAIDDGAIAARAHWPVEMPGGGQVEGLPLFSLKAYHGTPHEVDRFSSDKIGTGEGAQAYGIGLYFAETEAVARQYRDALSDWSESYDPSDPLQLAAAYSSHFGDGAIERLRYVALQKSQDRRTAADAARFLKAAGAIESGVELPSLQKDGHIYQVDLDTAPEHMLDWDKPINEQSDYVRSALKVPKSEALQKEASDLHRSLHFLKSLIEPSKAHKAEMRQIEARLQRIDPNQSVQWKALATTPDGAKKLSEAGIAGIRYLDGASRTRGIGTSNYVIFDDSKIRITHVDGQPVSEPSHTGGALFSLRDDARAQLKSDLEEAAAIVDAKAKAQRERQALIDEGIRKKNEGFVTTLRDARGQVDPAKALVYLIENHGEVDLPAGMTSVAAEQKAVEAMAKAGMEELLHTFRPQFGTGKKRQTARLTDVVRELAGEGTGDASAKGLAQAWSRTHERLRQEFNAAGGDIPKLEGWFLPQVHDRGALLGAGKTKWVNDIFRQLDLNRILDGETRQPLSREEIRKALGDIWENVTSDGHGTQAANAANPFGGITGDATGAKKLANQRQEHRFLHFRSADDWLAYQKQYGGGADPFRAMMQHITSMSKDIAAMRVLGTNPNRELARLAKFATKQASLARPAAVLIDEAVAKVQDLTERYLTAPTRLSEVNERIGAIHKDIARLREKRMGPPSKRNKKKIEGLRDELFKLDTERLTLMDNGRPRVDGLEGAALRLELQSAYDELASVQDVDKVLFPKKTEVLGKTMTHRGFWTTAPEDYARSYINRAEAMWDLYRGATSAPVNVKAAQTMQTLRNVGVIGRGGSMVLSSIADNFTQVMARRFTGLPAYKTFTDILAGLGPNATREAHRQALIGETYLHMFNDGARGAASVHGVEWSNYLAERTIALQGLGKLTDAQRQAFGMSVQASFADLAGKSFAEIAEINPRLQKLLVRYGIDAADWDAIRLDARTQKPREVDFLSPNLVRDDLEANDATNAARRVSERYLGMILQETDFASPTAMLRARAMMVGKTRPGTLVGELLRTGGQFKSFAFMYWMLHAERALREGIANGALKGASYAAQVVTVTTLGGALVVQLKDLKGGKDPRPMDRPGFWYAALTQGGGLGIWGDLLNSEQNRFGGGLVSTVGGPVVGLAEDALGAAGLSGKTTARRGTARLATSYVPGSSLWYVNLAWQRIAAESLQRQLDPTAYDAFRRRQQSQMKDYGNGFWWAPGDTAPGRGPRMN